MAARWICLLILVLAQSVFAAERRQKPIVEGELAQLPEMNTAMWSERTSVDEKSCRVLKAGSAGVINVPAWWGGSLRPKEGDNFVAEIEFQDLATAPIRVEIMAGLPGKYELHRIGGLNDAAWKVARVPVPWDMVMRTPKSENVELTLAAAAGADIPVHKVSIVAADPARDEAQWAAETRDWVARVQAEKKEAKPAEPQKALLAGSYTEKKLVPFARSYATVIQRTSAPQEGEAGAPVALKMARNEIEPAQFGVYANGADLADVRVSIGKEGLTTEKGDKLKADVELLAAEYAFNNRGAIFPMRLWPAYPVSIPAGRSHLFWITVNSEKGKAKPGVYSGKITISAADVSPEEIPVSVEVFPVDLLSMKDAQLHMGSCVTGLLPAHELRTLVRHNQNSINLWYYGFAPKIIKKSATEFDLDFTVCDEFMRHARAAGIENFVFFLGGNPYGFPDTMQLERELYRQVHYDGTSQMEGRKEFIRKVTAAPDKLLPEIRALYVQWVRKFMQHAKDQNWPEPILTPFDEPAKWVQGNNRKMKLFHYIDQKTKAERLPHIELKKVDEFLKTETEAGNKPEELGTGGAAEWIKHHFKDTCAAMKEAWPQVRIYGSIHHADSGLPFLEDIQVFCTNAIHEDHKLGDKVRAGGPDKTFWQYSGGGDSAQPSGPRYAFGYFFGAYDSRGSLCWAYNFGSRFDTSNGDNWIYAWTTPYSVAISPCWEGIREAWDDRRYIETLKAEAKKKGREQEANELLESIFNAAVKSRTADGRDTVNDFFARSQDPDALDTMRGKIRAMLVELKK